MTDPYRTSPRTDDITDADRYPVRVFVDGNHIRDVKMTRAVMQAYLADTEPPLPDDWTPPRMSIAHLISAQLIARNTGAVGTGCRYRMRGEALAEIDAAVAGGPWASAPDYAVAAKPYGEAPAFWMTFRGFPVFVDETVPWCDFEVLP